MTSKDITTKKTKLEKRIKEQIEELKKCEPKTRPTPLSDDGAYRLGGAIIEQACKDFLRAVRAEKGLRKRDPGITTKRRLFKDNYPSIYGKVIMMSWTIKECSDFLQSDYANRLQPNTDTTVILQKLQEMEGIAWV